MNVMNVEPNERKPGKTTPRRTKRQWQSRRQLSRYTRREPQCQHRPWRYKSARNESGPEQRHDRAGYARSGSQKCAENVVLARGMLDKLEGPKYAERRAELRRKAREAARARDRQTTAASQNEAEESDESGEETAGERTTRVGRTRGGMKVAARIGEKLRREIGSGRRPRVGDG